MTSEVLQKLNLTQSPLCKDLLAENVGDFFDCNSFASMVVGGCAAVSSMSKTTEKQKTGPVYRWMSVQHASMPETSDLGLSDIGLSDIPYNAVGSLAQLLCYVISLVNDEVLVEDLEDLAPLQVSHLVAV